VDILTARQAADALGCSRRKVYQLFEAGELRGHRVGTRVVVHEGAVEEYRERHSNKRPTPRPVRRAEKLAPPPVDRPRPFRHGL
jgi:excisionase family DNA binding protein